jgi:hypothetical protein
MNKLTLGKTGFRPNGEFYENFFVWSLGSLLVLPLYLKFRKYNPDVNTSQFLWCFRTLNPVMLFDFYRRVFVKDGFKPLITTVNL